MKNKIFATALATLTAASLCFAFTACNGDEEQPKTPTAPATDEHYKTLTYNYDGGSFEYMLYLPDAYSATGDALPLITYMPDAAYVGKKVTTLPYTQCAKSWITEEKMKRAPAVFLLLLPNEPETTYAVDLVDAVCESYNVDTDRLYLTGQSAGGIMDFIVNDAHPDKFAATVYCGCQPGNNVPGQEIDDLETGGKVIAEDEDYTRIIANANFVGQKFVYICSRKDGKAPFGQDDVTAVLDERGVEYGLDYGLDCNGGAALEAAVQAVLDGGYDHNFLGFTQVDNGTANMEHMMSFSYCYAVDAVYYWLLQQSL